MMSLDVVRALSKTKGEALIALKKKILSVTGAAEGVDELEEAGRKVETAVDQLLKSVVSNQENIEVVARDLTVSIAYTYIAALLIGE